MWSAICSFMKNVEKRREIMDFLDFHFVGNTAKGRISKWVFYDNKSRQIFRKTNIFYPLIRTRECVSGVKNVRFSENLA